MDSILDSRPLHATGCLLPNTETHTHPSEKCELLIFAHFSPPCTQFYAQPSALSPQPLAQSHNYVYYLYVIFADAANICAATSPKMTAVERRERQRAQEQCVQLCRRRKSQQHRSRMRRRRCTIGIIPHSRVRISGGVCVPHHKNGYCSTGALRYTIDGVIQSLFRCVRIAKVFEFCTAESLAVRT